MRDKTVVDESELQALEALKADGSPMAMVLYHMSNRQLAMVEAQIEIRSRVSEVEREVLRYGGRQRRLVEALENRLSNGSKPRLKAVVFGEEDG